MSEHEPILLGSMRRWPKGEVRHTPGDGIGVAGMSTAGFLSEFDEYIRSVKADAWDEGYRNGYSIGYADDPAARTNYENPYSAGAS
jgi:hypothetical protein